MKPDSTSRILVATDVATDADLVRRLLADEFEQLFVSTDADRVVADFEASKPDVLVLAFNALQKAEQYYLGLYRLSKIVPASSHRTVILCGKDDVRRVFELCRREYFDDYVLFWPMTHDAPRLAMAVHHALRQLRAVRASPAAAGEFAAQARRIAELESQLAQYTARGAQRIEAASQSLRQAGQEIGDALDGFSRQVAEGEFSAIIEVRDPRGFRDQMTRLKKEQIEPRLQSAAQAVTPVRLWASALREDLAPQLESARALRSLAENIRPVVLVVDDDELQHKLLAKALADANLELVFAASGTEALGMLRRKRPNLVLMDIELPDIDGVEATRRIKSVDQFKTIPVVMITGHSEKAMVVDSLRAGAADFIVKPFDKETLTAKVRRLLAGT